MKKDQNQLTWLMVSLIAFNMVWGLGNVVNNYSQQGISVIVSWILILALYFIPYALIVGQLGSTFKESGGGVSDWVEKTSTKRLAYFAAWTYWVVHIPYLAQKPQGVLIPLGWALQGNGNFLSNLDIHWIVILSLLIFGAFLYLSTKGLSTLKVIGGLAGSAMLIMSILFVLLAVGAPFIKPDMQFATANMDKQTRNPAKEFPKGMIVMAVMVGASAILGSLAMGMLFDGSNIPDDLMRNGAYQAFQKLGNYWGVGNLLVVIYALTNMVGQIAALAFSIDAPLQILLNNADAEFVPSWLRKRTSKGVLINGYILTGILVSLLIILPIFGIKEIDGLVKWMTNLNSIVMPMRYLWVFLAYMLLNKAWKKYKNAEYKLTKNPKVGFVIGAWCFLFTAFACILGMVPKVDYAQDPAGWKFSLLTNVLTPLVLISLGIILPLLAKREKRQARRQEIAEK